VIDFEGRVAIVTGAGRGLGRLYALELARRGSRVVVNDLGTSVHGQGADASVAAQLVAEIEDLGGVAVASEHSVANPAGGQAIIDTALDEFGRVDAVVSNAGILKPAPFEELTNDDWRRTLGVHLDGAFHVAQPAFRAMKRQGYGRFVFISSSAGAFGQHETAHYSAAKTGLWGLANVIALEGADHGILANAVLPFGRSRMADATNEASDQAAPGVDLFLDTIKPELVVPLVVFLASPRCDFTHQIYSAGGGRFARVFVGLGEGWFAGDGATPTADDVAAHLAEIMRLEPHSVPMSIYEEVAQLLARVHGQSGAAFGG
jgi:NAD(P)-dependent dehydrogenase (short-subunit alcohol dehydrogenase family)